MWHHIDPIILQEWMAAQEAHVCLACFWVLFIHAIFDVLVMRVPLEAITPDDMERLH